MIIFEIIMSVLPEKRKEIFQTLLSRIEAIRKEKGCRNCHVFQDIENENVFCLLKEWETREDLDHHMRSPIYGVLLGTEFLLKEPHDIQVHTISNTEGKEIVNTTKCYNLPI